MLQAENTLEHNLQAAIGVPSSGRYLGLKYAQTSLLRFLNVPGVKRQWFSTHGNVSYALQLDPEPGLLGSAGVLYS